MREADISSPELKFWVYVIICLILLSFAGLASGLSLGLFAYSQVDLEVLIKAGLPHEKKNAAKILPIVKNQYLLLCTLLIAKSLALEALPIFLDRILPFWVAIIVSATIIVAFAEVIPQAVCSRYALSFSAKFVLFVRLLLLLVFPLSYPFSKLLDWLLGKGHSALLRRGQLKTLVDLLSIKAGRGGELTDDETTIITGALDMTEKTAKDAMTPISAIFSLDINAILDMHTMGLIMSKGHSRVPFYSDNPRNIIGLVLVKNLIFCDPQDKIPLKNLSLRRIPRVYDNWPLYDVLKLFQKGHGHMAVVVKSQGDGKETEEKTTAGIPKLLGTNSPFGQKELFVNNFANSSQSECETQISIVENVVEKLDNVLDQWNKWEPGGNISIEDLESLKTKFSDEEVIGIVTMEDVMEELLQEEILDETDLNVHNKIRMTSLTWRRSPSPTGLSSDSQIHWGTPATSSFSSYCNTPFLHSPISPYAPSPLLRATMHTSPTNSSCYNTPLLHSPISPRPLVRATLHTSPRKSILGCDESQSSSPLTANP